MKTPREPILHMHRSQGFTLIEVMIAMTIFIVLIVVGMGAALDSIRQHRAAESMRTVMDNLNFVMEDMARNLRVGSNFRCLVTYPDSAAHDSSNMVIPQDCPYGTNSVPHNVLLFDNLKGEDQMYLIDNVTKQIQKTAQIPVPGYASVPSTASITPPEVTIDFSRSGFDVTGSAANDGMQPMVTIRLAGTIQQNNVTSDFSIQTTVTARQLDS